MLKILIFYEEFVIKCEVLFEKFILILFNPPETARIMKGMYIQRGIFLPLEMFMKYMYVSFNKCKML